MSIPRFTEGAEDNHAADAAYAEAMGGASFWCDVDGKRETPMEGRPATRRVPAVCAVCERSVEMCGRAWGGTGGERYVCAGCWWTGAPWPWLERKS